MLPFYIACIKRKKDCNQLNFTSQEVEKEEQMKNKVNRRKKITIRAEINKIEKRKKKQQKNQQKLELVFEKNKQNQ